MDLKKIDIGNGRTAISFVPEDSKELAIVPLGTIQKLARMLPKALFGDILDEVVGRLNNADNLPHMVDIMEEEVAFHRTINLIEQYVPDKVPRHPVMA